jgi:hypothetical protein
MILVEQRLCVLMVFLFVLDFIGFIRWFWSPQMHFAVLIIWLSLLPVLLAKRKHMAGRKVFRTGRRLEKKKEIHDPGDHRLL